MTRALDALIDAGLDTASLVRVRQALAETREPPAVVVSRLGLMSDEQLLGALASAFKLPVVTEQELENARGDTVITSTYLRAHRAIVLAADSASARLAVVDPESVSVTRGVAFGLGVAVEPVLVGFDAWRSTFDRLYPDDRETKDGAGSGRRSRWANDATGLRELSLDAPAVRRVEALLSQAITERASDIHVERTASGGRVRFRVDGILKEVGDLSPALSEAVIARLKVLADLDVADHRRSQDGRTTLSARGRPIDARLSIIPSIHGEGVVIRLLDRADIQLDFGALGFRAAEIERIEIALKRPQGLVLVSGPTGGGKTTTLYAGLNLLRSPTTKTVTVEDPVEYAFEGVHQTQLDDAGGLGFGHALRAFLRHDPDVILVGEIRDPDTAKTAVQAALTGHLVLSTLHANDAASVPARLIEMGVEPYLLASTLTATSAQRLVRRLCPVCAERADAPTDLLERIGVDLPKAAFRSPKGCPACSDGYAGRMVMSETLVFTPEVAGLVRDRASIEALRAHVSEPLVVDGLTKAAAGMTSVDEVLRALEATS